MRIAIAEDDKDARDYVSGVLTTAGYDCIVFPNGRDLTARLKRETFDLLILDWNMPGQTAIEVIEWVRASMTDQPRMIVLTSRSEEKDMTFALDAGADDFITKPGSPEVIRARVAATLRRRGTGQSDTRLDQRGRFVFDKLEQTVTFDGEIARLTAKEFALALLFFDNLQRPLSRGYIMQRIWSNTADLSTRTLDMHVSKLRAKLGLRPENGYRLQTIFGYGYRLDTFDGDVAELD
jgi:DNA-binding response OmpR family regulator